MRFLSDVGDVSLIGGDMVATLAESLVPAMGGKIDRAGWMEILDDREVVQNRTKSSQWSLIA